MYGCVPSFIHLHSFAGVSIVLCWLGSFLTMYNVCKRTYSKLLLTTPPHPLPHPLPGGPSLPLHAFGDLTHPSDHAIGPDSELGCDVC